MPSNAIQNIRYDELQTYYNNNITKEEERTKKTAKNISFVLNSPRNSICMNWILSNMPNQQE